MAFASFGFILDGIVFLLRFLYEIQIDTRTNTRADMQQLKGSFALMGQYFPVFFFFSVRSIHVERWMAIK